MTNEQLEDFIEQCFEIDNIKKLFYIYYHQSNQNIKEAIYSTGLSIIISVSASMIKGAPNELILHDLLRFCHEFLTREKTISINEKGLSHIAEELKPAD